VAGDIISKHTRLAFRDQLGFWYNFDIAAEFGAAGIERAPGPLPSERHAMQVAFIEQYYRSVDFTDWTQVRKVLKVYEAVLLKLENAIASAPRRYKNSPQQERLEVLTSTLDRDGFQYENGVIAHKVPVTSLPMMHEAAAPLDVPELRRQLARISDAISKDPGLAIGTAKEVVETTCKTILHARKIAFDEGAELSELVKTVRRELRLLPEDVPSASKGADTMKRVLANLGTLAQGLGELRNLYGTGHGKTGKVKELSARHARLAVGSAATLATFLLETHEETGT
jgi:hypothetical protein